MKKPYALGLLILISILIYSCKSDDEPSVSGIPITNTSCNSFKSGPDTLTIPADQSCVFYIYDPLTKRLTINHKNAGFNCCPEMIYYKPVVAGSLITISEFEEAGLCNCNCLYDLDMTIEGIGYGIYTLKFIEPYRRDQQELIFEIDLVNNLQGLYCVTRDQYPWGIFQ